MKLLKPIIAEKQTKSNENTLKFAEKSPLTAIEISDELKLLESDLKNSSEDDWLLPFAFMKNTIIVLYAPAGSGKTFSAQALVKYFATNKKTKVVHYVDGDNGTKILAKRRVNGIIKFKGIKYVATTNPRISSKVNDNFMLLKRYIEKTEEDLTNQLFIIDSMKDFIGSFDLLSNRDMNEFMSMIMKLRTRGASIILLHHTNKIAKDKEGNINVNQLNFTGSQMIQNSIDTSYMVVPLNQDTSVTDGFLNYEFRLDKNRVGCTSFFMKVYTADSKDAKNRDIELDFPSIRDFIDEKKFKTIDKIINILNRDGEMELDDLYKKLKVHRKNKNIQTIINDYNLIFWGLRFGNRKRRIYVK